MKRLLYPLIASALITILPFLITFEKGQDIIRGLFGYEYFALLLFIVFIKNYIQKEIPAFAGTTGLSLRNILQMPKQSLLKFATAAFLLGLLIATLSAIAWIDLQNLLVIKDKSTGWYAIIPFVSSGIAVAMIWTQKPFKFNTICFILFAALILHLGAYNQYAAQPLAEFPTINYLERTAPKPVQRTELSEEFRNKYTITDSVTITRDNVDSSRSNVIILVESWGIPLDIQRFEEQINIFKSTRTHVGIHNRMYSRTRTAEREDLIKAIIRDSVTQKRDTLFLPKKFNDIGYKTTFLFGGDSLEQWRYKYIPNIGFSEIIYGKQQNNNAFLNDSAMISKIDSILADTTQKHFIAWTTRDTKFPMPEFSRVYRNNANSVDSVYSAKLRRTLMQIAELARNHPEVRFIVQGDHNPIASPKEFQEKFYKRWVPFIILN